MVKAVSSGFHFFKLITAGSSSELKNPAHVIPIDIDITYPIYGRIGEVVIIRNAEIVVTLVTKIGTKRESMVDATAFLVSFFERISLKNFETICTPSEFAIVSKIIGIEVLARVNKNLFDPVK